MSGRSPLSRRRALAWGAGTLGAALLAPACGRALVAPTVDPALPLPSGAPLRRGRVVDAAAFGVRGDGVADDTDALVAALAATPAGGTLALGPGGHRLRAPLVPGPGVTVAGVPGRTRLLVGDGPGLRAAVVLGAPDVTLDGLVLERTADVATVLVRVGAADRAALSRVVLLGHAEAWSSFGHGIQLGTADGTVTTGLRLVDSVVSACTYGLYQANESTAVTQDVRVTGCTFARNANTDLEFNSPAGSFRGVRVEDCAFRDNDSPGFAVGVAYCADVAVRRCRVSGYRMEAVHVEDWSDAVTVEDSTFTACGLVEFAHVQVISGSSGVTVRGNTHDATANTNPIAVVSALPGGRGRTAGGRPVVAPRAVTVADNVITLAAGIRAVALDDVVGGAITGNRIDGPGAADAFALRGVSGVRVADNVVGGRPR